MATFDTLASTIKARLDLGKRVAVITRGLPGSGKTLLARRLTDAFEEKSRIVETDDYLGLYIKSPAGVVFNPALLGDAHRAARYNFRRALTSCSFVVQANTNTTPLEYAWYAMEAHDAGFDVIIANMAVDPETCFARQTHGVPRGAFDAMHARMEATGDGFAPFAPFNDVVAIE